MMEDEDQSQSSLWSGLQSAAGPRLKQFVRRRIVPIVLVVAVIAAAAFVTTGATLPDDGEPVAVSADAALAFATKIADSAGDAPGTKAVSLTITETELTSFLAIASLLSSGIEDAGGTGDLGELSNLNVGLPTAESIAVEDWRSLIESQEGLGSILTRGLDLRFTIRDPEVRFTRSGEIIVRGYGKLAFVSVPARIVVVPNVVDGQVEFDLVEGQLGRLPLPGGVASLVSEGIERALLGGHDIASVEQISVAEGSLRFVGQLNR